MNFFEKKHQHSTERSQEPLSARAQKKLFEFEGKYEIENKPRYDDDNLNMAI
jgi:hypothetical protein